MTDSVRIALDAFGGDQCPGPEVAAAVEAARSGVEVVLVGDHTRLASELSGHPGWADLPLSIHHAPDTIAMGDSPSKAVRAKPEASMPVCFDLVRQGQAQAAMSAGNSGAMLACGLFKFRRIKGVDRPALLTTLPTATGVVTFLDVGANVECRPINLVQFAVFGAVYARFKHGRSLPRVGLLSNGSEEGKGTELTRTTHRLLSEHRSAAFEYAGYAEGADLFRGEFDVIVTDGFTGNVALKVTEGTGRLIGRWIREAIDARPLNKIGALLMRGTFTDLKRALDPDTYGAAPLLGVGGLAFICHGGSSASALAHALRLAARSVAEELTPQLQSTLAEHAELFAASRATEPQRTPGTSTG